MADLSRELAPTDAALSVFISHYSTSALHSTIYLSADVFMPLFLSDQLHYSLSAEVLFSKFSVSHPDNVAEEDKV